MSVREGFVRPARRPDLGGLAILLAEDNVTNQIVAGEMLRSLGAEVDVASDGVEALEMLSARIYDMVLVDIEMPRLSGIDVIRRLRADDGEQARRPVVALTAYAMQEHREKIAAAGADGLIAKPILSVNDFGRDVLSYLDAPARRPAADTSRAVQPDVFASLADSVGPAAMRAVLERVLEDLDVCERQAREGAAEGDFHSVRTATHNLVSVAGSIGGLAVQRAAEAMNGLARDADAARLAAQAPELSAEIARLSDFVRRELDR